jgi:hypothetical protein
MKVTRGQNRTGRGSESGSKSSVDGANAIALVAGLGTRYEVQQGQHGEQRDERKGDPHGIGLFHPNVQKYLGDQRNGARNEGEQPCGVRSVMRRGVHVFLGRW